MKKFFGVLIILLAGCSNFMAPEDVRVQFAVGNICNAASLYVGGSFYRVLMSGDRDTVFVQAGTPISIRWRNVDSMGACSADYSEIDTVACKLMSIRIPKK